MGNITKLKTISQTLRVDNSGDNSRQFDITANVVVSADNGITSISTGTVSKDGMSLASFEKYSESMFNVSFVSDADTSAILEAVNAFIKSVVSELSEQ